MVAGAGPGGHVAAGLVAADGGLAFVAPVALGLAAPVAGATLSAETSVLEYVLIGIPLGLGLGIF